MGARPPVRDEARGPRMEGRSASNLGHDGPSDFPPTIDELEESLGPDGWLHTRRHLQRGLCIKCLGLCDMVSATLGGRHLAPIC